MVLNEVMTKTNTLSHHVTPPTTQICPGPVEWPQLLSLDNLSLYARVPNQRFVLTRGFPRKKNLQKKYWQAAKAGKGHINYNNAWAYNTPHKSKL